MEPQEYFNKVYADARAAGAEHVLAAIAAAQSAIETGWGKTVKGNAYFGIKAGPSWKGKTVSFTTHEVINGKRVKMVDAFRAYDSFVDSIKDHLSVVQEKWPKTYAASNIAEAAAGLDDGVHGKYATAPNYSRDVRATALSRAPAAFTAYSRWQMVPASKSVLKANPNSSILPLYRPKQSDDVTRAVLDKFANLVPADGKSDAVRVLFVRGYYLDSMGRKGVNDRALYDDAVFVVSPEGVQAFNGNSDPAVYRERVATIKAPQAVRYKPGLHGYSRKAGPYPAFRQDEKCKVVRDKVGDDYGMFHVNLHRGGVNGTSSLGCLTIPPHQWDEFYGLVKSLLDKHSQKTFYVTLVEYGGDNPPVKQIKNVAPQAVAAVGIAALVASWWSELTQWLGSFF